jgi:L-threonylcarbamoyladenylate synthase
VNRETIQKVLDQAVATLEKGGVILYPADTIWGIGCDATNPEAIARVYSIKGRSYNKPLIVLVPDLEQLYKVVKTVHPRIDTLLHLHERPLTIIYPAALDEYKHLTGPDGTIAVRVVNDGFCHQLLKAYGKPLVSTSANISGMESPTRFGSISSDIIRQVDYSVPAFTEKDLTGRPSVIAKYDENGELEFLR